MGIFGGAVAAKGDLLQGQAAQESADYQAQIAQMNATVATQNAAYETELGQSQAGTQQLKNRSTMGTIIAAQAANGLDVNSGSALTTRQGAAKMGAQSVANIENNSARQAYNYKVQAASNTAQAGLDVMQGNAARQQGNIAAIGSLLSGAGQDVSTGIALAALA